MATQSQTEMASPGDILLVIHDFAARSSDELTLARGDRIELIERDDEFGDGWFLGKHLQNGESGLFPEVYTTMAPKPTLTTAIKRSHAPQTGVGAAQSGPAALLEEPRNLQSPSANHDLSPSLQQSGTALTTSSARSSEGPSYTASNALGTGVLPTTPPTTTGSRRIQSSSSARSLSMSAALHENSPVMNETLSVIEEHITDMHTPRHSFLAPDERVEDEMSEFGGRQQNRLSYINGQETDEEESGSYSVAEVLRWTPAQVAMLLEQRGVDKQQCEAFLDEEINGEVLLRMDQSALMLKHFDLGKIGRRLALWHKIHEFQVEVSGPKRPPQGDQPYPSGPTTATQDVNRARSTSMGTVLPRIPGLMETPRHRAKRSLSQQQPAREAGFHLGGESPSFEHSPRPSAASIRSLNHNRRHSSIDYSINSQSQAGATQYSQTTPSTTGHTKQGSFDRTWTMASSFAAADDKSQTSLQLQSPSDDMQFPSPTTHELGMTVVSSLDLDRGYFSGNEVENRRARNVLRKRDSPTHARAPSDGYGHKRLSQVFRQRRNGSMDSITNEGAPASASQTYFGNKTGGRATSSPQFKTLRSTSPVSPTVTKLEYSDSPSIDAIAASPNLPGSETSSNERGTQSPATQGRFSRARATGLRAISDAITGNEKALAQQPQDRIPEAVKESPIQSASNAGSSTPSVNSKSLDLDEAALLKGASTNSTTKPPVNPRRKKKKETSAYMRGLEKKTPQEQMKGCDYSGWMKKKSSNLMTTWKTRLFVLRGRRLSYYYSENDTEEKGLIDISFHRVLPANNDRITGLHATVTGAAASPTSPSNAQIRTTASTDAAKATDTGKQDTSGVFIFKLVPPRSGLSKAVNFTKPTVHYFAVDSIQQGRLWMAALMKATIDRDESKEVITTYNQKTISLAKAKAMRQRPPALMGADDDEKSADKRGVIDSNEKTGLNINFNSEKEKDISLDGSTKEGSINSSGGASQTKPNGASGEYNEKAIVA